MIGFLAMGIITYLICAIPFGFVLAKLFLKQDIRKIGSGNIGATNVLRTGSKQLAFATLVLDAVKPLLAWYIVYLLWRHSVKFDVMENGLKMQVSAVAVLAHCFPVYLKFKGGKGVATAWGTMWLFSPWLALCSIGVWAATLAATRKSSLSALVALLFVPLWVYLFAPEAMPLYVALSVFIVVRHASNIRRLFAGAESNVNFRKEKDGR